jgi:hypothetical protein
VSTRTGGADDDDAVMGFDPVRFGQGQDLGALKASVAAGVDSLDGGGEAELGRLQGALDAPATS